MSKQVDLHGVRLEDLNKILDTLIVDALIKNYEQIEVITGTGILQHTIIEKCKELYDYDAKVSIGNSGVIIISLEK